jgi:hypothetical protein
MVVCYAGWDAVDAAASDARGDCRASLLVSDRQRAGRSALQRLFQDFDRPHTAGRSDDGGCCGRQSRVVLAPVAGVKLAEARASPTGIGAPYSPTTVTRGIRRRGATVLK